MKKSWVWVLCLLVSLSLAGAVMALDSGNNSQQELLQQQLDSRIQQLLQLQAMPPAAMDQEMGLLAASAAPPLTGTYKGTFASINSNGVCGRQTVVLRITKQCNNLLKGTLKVGTNTPIPVLGKHSLTGTISYVSMSGSYSTTNPYTYLSVSFSGQYLTSPTPIFRTSYFYFSSSATSGVSYQYDYDASLTKQPEP